MGLPLILSLVFGAGANAAANLRRVADGRVWVAFAVGGGVFFVVQFVSRPLVALVSMLGGWQADGTFPSWLFVAVNVVLAELFKLTAALVLHSAYRSPVGEASGTGAAVGAGFAVWYESLILSSAFQISRLALPGGQSLVAALVASLARVLAGSATTGLGAGLAVRGQLAGGVVLAVAAQLLLDPGLRVLLWRPWMTVAATALVSGVLFAWLVVWGGGRTRAVPPGSDGP
ncbi:MAG: hypothetical protein QN163_05115 [Armatimonadota bacterium]|nr:hypothetical protein [Armatimonadota bacterium]MDR5697019.1 hypothetical protein [Armatimonadota bacterium]